MQYHTAVYQFRNHFYFVLLNALIYLWWINKYIYLDYTLMIHNNPEVNVHWNNIRLNFDMHFESLELFLLSKNI